MTDELFQAIENWLALGWEWRIIVKTVNRQQGTAYLSKSLQALYRRERRRREEERIARKLEMLESQCGIWDSL